MKIWIKRAGLILAFVLFVVALVVTLIVELEADYVHEDLGRPGIARALVLYHPSRDARFSDDLSLAVARGFQRAGMAVGRATLTSETPERPEGYTIIAVVSNTYYWTPDLPTLRYLKRARLDETPVIGLMGGAGSTNRSQRVLDEALRRTGARSVETRSFWLWRPNEEARTDEPNRSVAIELAESFGFESGIAAQEMEP